MYSLSCPDYFTNLTNHSIVEIMSKTRTAGDGMESDENTSERVQDVGPNIPRTPERKGSAVPTRLVQIYATKVIKSDKRKSINMKTPKFVPYEPYPAAVKPMTPQLASKEMKKSRNNMDINTLITQMSQMNTDLNEFKPRPKSNSTSDKSGQDVDAPSPEKIEMQKKIDSLTQENESLKEQLKQQVQVHFQCNFAITVTEHAMCYNNNTLLYSHIVSICLFCISSIEGRK